MKRFFAAALFAALSLSACVITPSPKLETPSGKPEVIVPSATKKEVIDAIANQMLTAGYEIKSMSEYVAEFRTRYNSSKYLHKEFILIPKERRVRFNVVETDEGVRAVATLETATNPDKPFEQVSETKYGSRPLEIQDILEKAKASLAK